MSLKIFKRPFRGFTRVLTRSLFVTTIHQSADRTWMAEILRKNSNERHVFLVSKNAARVIENEITLSSIYNSACKFTRGYLFYSFHPRLPFYIYFFFNRFSLKYS